MAKGQVKTPILVINGADDGFLKPEQVAAFKKEAALPPPAPTESAKFELSALKYDAEADRKAWRSMQDFFKRVFGK